MAEVLGVVSTAAELATLCCSLLRLLKSIKAAPLTLQNYGLQLQDLTILSSSISHNPLLQTREIESLTQSLHSLISRANLTVVLKRHKIIRAFYLLCRERELADTLSAVERQKLSLCLSIEQVQSTVLYEIRSSLQIMSSSKQNIGKKRSASEATDETSNPSELSTPRVKQQTMAAPAPKDSKDASNSIQNEASSIVAYKPAPNRPNVPEASWLGNDGNGQHVLSSDFSHIYSTGNVDQKVGIVFRGTGANLSRIRNNLTISDVHQGAEGEQRIESSFDFYGDLDDNFDIKNLAAKTHHIFKHGEAGDSSKPKSKQYVQVIINQTDEKRGNQTKGN